MGGNGSTRRVSFEADENENITVVKGIRLSDSVINRMREPVQSVVKPQPPPSSPPLTQQAAPAPDHAPPVVSAAVKEEEIRRRIAEQLAQDQAKKDYEQKRLELERINIHKEITRVMEQERAAANDQLSRAIIRERASAEEERRNAQRLAKQLEEKEGDLKKQEAYYKEQVGRLEERSAQFYKVTTEEYQKAVSEVKAKFKQYKSHPFCADLQGEVLRCYQANPYQTLSCSVLARQYLQCVNNAKQSSLRKGG
ncbi:coiled-coil-helix-coiled-coil-helix domain containing 3a isoform X2 [Latimeria chalumnae]|nr:PREDICTED: MICOS complex subunit MIC19 isoform X2 [Latimeria chalumnae]|eukprot:XP_014348971.1 PREDICTED: MICOS complex subunit MIC19 isoform X2 [Latimeria chalumnae]